MYVTILCNNIIANHYHYDECWHMRSTHAKELVVSDNWIITVLLIVRKRK